MNKDKLLRALLDYIEDELDETPAEIPGEESEPWVPLARPPITEEPRKNNQLWPHTRKIKAHGTAATETLTYIAMRTGVTDLGTAARFGISRSGANQRLSALKTAGKIHKNENGMWVATKQEKENENG